MALMACVLLAGCRSDSVRNSTSVFSLQGEDVFVHKPSGMKFPKQMGLFERGAVSPKAATGSSIAVMYRATKCPYTGVSLFLNTSVLITPARGISPETALRVRRASFAQDHPDAKLETAEDGANGFTYFTHLRPNWNDLAGDETHVIQHGDHLVICSFSFLAARRDDWRTSIDRFVRTFAAQ